MSVVRSYWNWIIQLFFLYINLQRMLHSFELYKFFAIVIWKNWHRYKYIKCIYFQGPDIIHSTMQSNQIVIATILDQVHFRISSSSSYYGLIIICLLLPWRGLTIKIGLNYAINIALSYQIQFTRLLLIGDSLIVGLFYYPNIWRIYFKPLNAMNLWCRRR